MVVRETRSRQIIELGPTRAAWRPDLQAIEGVSLSTAPTTATPARPKSRRRVAVTAAAVGVAALGMATSASAATFTFPSNQTFSGDAAGWESTEAICTSSLLAELPLCQTGNEFRADVGAPAGSIESRYATLLGALDDIEAETQTTWSTTFTYNQGNPTGVSFSYDRRAELLPAINLGRAQSQVTLTDLATAATTVIVPLDTPTFTPLFAAEAAFETVTANVAPGHLRPGHTYRLDIQTFLRGTLTVLGGQRVNYDNVRLTVEAPPGDGGDGRGTSTGPRGPFQILPGAGGLGACTTDDRRVPQPPKGQGNPAGIRLSAAQLLINQRISQAAVRRVNSTIDRVTKGLTGNDIRDCALGWDDFNSSFTASLVGPDPVGTATGVAEPRTTPTRVRQAADPASVKLERTQLVISQRISQAAVRRVNAATKRLNALTAGDFQLGTIGAAALATEMRRVLGGGAPNNTAGSTAFVPITSAPAGPRNPGAVKLTRGQLLINQRISQAAVRRINHLTAELASGITSRQIVDGSITRANLTPAVQINQR